MGGTRSRVGAEQWAGIETGPWVASIRSAGSVALIGRLAAVAQLARAAWLTLVGRLASWAWVGWVMVLAQIRRAASWALLCGIGPWVPMVALPVTAAGQQAEDGAQTLSASVPTVRADGRLEYTIGVGAGGIEVDGRLDEAAWSHATVIAIDFEVNPGDNTPARVATECRLTQDEAQLYLGCTAADPSPADIRAYVVDRDAILGHDRIVLTLDPFNDQRRAFQFGISALGVQYDAVLAQQGAGGGNQDGNGLPIDPSWDAIWSSAGAITDDGYVIEAAIPFRSLRFPSSVDASSWGAYLTRWLPRSSNVEMRSATWDRSNSCVLCQANLLHGVRGTSPGTNIQLTPTMTASRTDRRNGPASGRLTPGQAQRDFGLDAQWGVTSDLTLNLTANPDFSQVEADAAQLDVNNRFALFFPEKRPFFLEGADFFGTLMQAVFTRSIADPIGGAKATGKLGSNAVGVLVARDRSNNLLIPSSQFSSSTNIDAEVTTAVARFRRDVGGASTVGGLFTGRESAGYHNRVGGFDAFYRPLPTLTVQAQLLRSDTQYPTDVAARLSQPTGPFTGNAMQGRARWTTNDWVVSGDYGRTDEGFRADAGFVTQAGVQGGNMRLVRRWWGGGDRWFDQLQVIAGVWRQDDSDQRRIGGGGWMGFEYQGAGQTSFSIWPNFGMTQRLGRVTYSGMNHVFYNFGTAPSGRWSFRLNGMVGDQVDFANGGIGTQLLVTPATTVRLGRNVEARLQHTYQSLKRGGVRVFTANLTQLRGVYNFSTRSFLRTVLQYRQTDRSPGQYTATVDPRSRSLFAQILYAYKVNPQTVLFVGYSQDRDGGTDLEMNRAPLSTRGRTFFLKFGYAWRP